MLKPGEVVRYKEQSCQMVVEIVKGQLVTCCWFVGRNQYRDTFLDYELEACS